MRILPVFLLAAATASAQVSERVEVSVVNVDVTVTKDGRPVRGLSRDDFEVFEDGRRQAITNFYVVEEPGRTEVRPTSEAVVAPELQDPRFRRRVLVLVDVFHTTRNRRALALAGLEKMIDESFRTGEYDWSVGVLGRGVTMVLPLTTDKAAIHDIFARMLAISERTTRPLASDLPVGLLGPVDSDVLLDRAMSYDEQDQIYRGRFTTQAIIDAVRGFASTSGKKIVLLLTGDPGLNDLQLGDANFGPRGGALFQRPLTPDFGRRAREITDLRTSIVREANASGVSMYIMNTEGLQPLGDMGAAPAPMTNTSAVFWLSKETGGRLVTGNDAGAALNEFDAASSNYYSLGYRPPHPDDGKYHRIEVRIRNGNGARLEYRSGYSSAPPDAELARAMESPIAATLLPKSLPVALTAGQARPDKRGIVVPISVRVPFSSLQFLPVEGGTASSVLVFVSVFDETGKKLFSGAFPLGIRLRQPDPAGVMVYKNEVVLGKGTAGRIVAAVRDEATENVGVAEINVTTR